MQIADNFRQIFFRFVFSGHIVKFDSVGRFHIDFGIAFTQIKHHGVVAAGTLHQFFGKELPQQKKDQNRHNPTKQKRENGRHLFHNFAGELCPGIVQTLCEVRIVHQPSFINNFSVFVRKKNAVAFHLHFTDFPVFRH